MVKVGIGSSAACFMSRATTSVESKPPLRKPPTGTSLTMCSRTLSIRTASSCSISSSSEPWCLGS